jgi:hypothetical protein
MTNALSIIQSDESSDLETRREDVAAAVVRGIVGAAPFVGPLLSEAITATIPNQKIDRVIAFAKELDDRVRYLEGDTVKLRMKDEEFTDLLEDGLIQASRAMSPERRSYIASLLVNSITNKQLSHIEEKKLLSLLGELNDAEILTLKFYSLLPNEKREFAALHEDLFKPISRTFRSPQIDLDRGALHDSYRAKLIEVGLLDLDYKRVQKGEMPEFDERTGRIRANGYKLTSLGKLLLRSIEQQPVNSREAAN